MIELTDTTACETFSPSALAIMAVAERLVGKHGIDGVSMRQITKAAGMANNSAIAYHFGDRDALLRAISRWRMPAIAFHRQRLVAEAIATGAIDQPIVILRIITRPVLTIRGEDGSHPHAAFVSQMLRSRPGRQIRNALWGQSGLIEDLTERLQSLVAEAPRAVFEFRLRTGSLAFYDAVVERDQLAADDPAALAISDEEFLAELDAMLLAIIDRPATP